MFVVGNPGSTSRLNTVAHLEYLRNLALPHETGDYSRTRKNFSKSSAGAGRRRCGSRARICTVSRIAESRWSASSPACGPGPDRTEGGGGTDPSRPDRGRLRRESRLTVRHGTRSPARSTPPERSTAQPCTSKAARPSTPSYSTSHGRSFGSSKRTRNPMPSGFASTATRRASLERSLYSPAPIYPEYEEAKLACSLAYWKTHDGRFRSGRRPRARRQHPERRPKAGGLAGWRSSGPQGAGQGGRAAVAASADTMIRLARDIDAEARAIRKIPWRTRSTASRRRSMP